MHIAIDCRFWGPVATGLGRYTENLVMSLKNLNNDTQYTLIVDPENAPDKVAMDERFHLNSVHVAHHTVKEQLIMTSMMLRLNVDLFHFPHYIVPIINGHKPFVVTIHDIIKHKFPNRDASTLSPLAFALKYNFYKLTLKNAVKDSRHIIVDSKHVLNDLTSNFSVPEEKISVIPLAADDRFTDKLDINKYSYAYTPKSFLLVVGNAYPYKNVETIIDALPCLSNEIQLVLVGTRDVFVERLLAHARKNSVESRVHLMGYVDDVTLSYLYQTALAYVSASFEEGFGIQPLEAMRLGCPVILSDIPTYREVCDKAALYFEPHDHDQLVNQIHELNSDGHRQKMIKLGSDRVKDYSWHKTALATYQVYGNAFENK